jgi:xylulokinase
MGVMLSATDCLNWLSRITGQSPSDLTKSLGDTLAAPGSVQFFPYLSGERTPHNDSQIRGGFTGLATNTSQEDLTRAVLEGVAFGLRDSYEALKSTGAAIESLMAIGGGSASGYWLKLIATCLDVPLLLPRGREFGAALGAARLALLAAGDAEQSDVIVAPEISGEIEPDRAFTETLEQRYQSFRTAFGNLRAMQ